MFSEISNDAPKYITVSGTFTNCTGEQKICLYVDEPKSHSNAKQSCLKFNPSPITG
jgi:hypothetical protein